MPIQSRYLFTASMDVEPAKEALFNEVYDTEHVPLILTVPGIISATRYRAQPVTMMLGGERKTIMPEGEPRYKAVYELESPDWEAKVRASKFTEWPGYGRAPRGHIALQDHGDPVAFRNIRIRELP